MSEVGIEKLKVRGVGPLETGTSSGVELRRLATGAGAAPRPSARPDPLGTPSMALLEAAGPSPVRVEGLVAP